MIPSLLLIPAVGGVLAYFVRRAGPRRALLVLAAVAHALCAIAAILIWIVHVYAAIWVKGTLRAMTRGSVTGGWAWKHHRKWFRQEVGKP